MSRKGENLRMHQNVEGKLAGINSLEFTAGFNKTGKKRNHHVFSTNMAYVNKTGMFYIIPEKIIFK